MKKSVVFNLKPDENNQFKADMYHDSNLVKQADLSKDELKEYMDSKFDNQSLNHIRKAIGLFKPKEIKIILKEN